MTHHPTRRTPAVQPGRPEHGATSALEVQLEGRLVARCGADVMLRRAAHDRTTHDRTTLVDWFLPSPDDTAE